jgi:hypothetical protein
MTRFTTCAAGVAGWLVMAGLAEAQPLGTFRWQLQPFCNVVTLAVTQNGGVYRLEGTDDQCGAGADRASAIGMAFQNPDGTIGFGFTVVTTPGGVAVHVDAAISLATMSGTWRDSASNGGNFVFTPGGGTGGSLRPLPAASAVPVTIQLRPDGGLMAGGTLGAGTIPAAGAGVRMMWHPAKAAFRAGEVLNTGWDDSNVGAHSVAFGFNAIARGRLSTALGFDTRADGNGSTAFGDSTSAPGIRSTAMGFNTDASGDTSTALGNGTNANGTNSTAMGHRTEASGPNSTAMGVGTRATAAGATAIGENTTASGVDAVAMGVATVASGPASLAAGAELTAAGTASMALGTFATASSGSFVFGDRSTVNTRTPIIAFAPNQFLARAVGGYGLYSNAALTAGVTMAAGASAWASVSDRARKRDFRDLPGDDVLDKLARMPIQEWSYNAQDAAIRHVGPTAQDFHAAFGLGEDPLRISTIDADGIALRAVQALELRDRTAAAAQADEIAALRAEISALTGQLTEALRRIATQR